LLGSGHVERWYFNREGRLRQVPESVSRVEEEGTECSPGSEGGQSEVGGVRR